MRKNGECGRNDGRKSFPEVFVGDFEVLFQASVISEIRMDRETNIRSFC